MKPMYKIWCCITFLEFNISFWANLNLLNDLKINHFGAYTMCLNLSLSAGCIDNHKKDMINVWWSIWIRQIIPLQLLLRSHPQKLQTKSNSPGVYTHFKHTSVTITEMNTTHLKLCVDSNKFKVIPLLVT